MDVEMEHTESNELDVEIEHAECNEFCCPPWHVAVDDPTVFAELGLQDALKALIQRYERYDGNIPTIPLEEARRRFGE